MKKRKKCNECNKSKEVNKDNFYKRSSNKDGYDNKCKECTQSYMKARRNKLDGKEANLKKDRLNSTAYVWNESTIKEIIDGFRKWVLEAEDNIFVGEYLTTLGLTTQTLMHRLVDFPWLKEEYDEIRNIQQFKLLKLGLFRETDSGLTKFVLTNMHEWSDKSKVDNSLSFDGLDINKLVGFKDDKKDE